MNCEKCNKEHDGKFGSGRFCSSRCSHARIITDEWKANISKKLRKYTYNKCENCGKIVYKNRFCSKSCAGKKTHDTEKYRRVSSISQKKRFSSLKGRNFLKEIGRKGGFGKKGYTKKGNYFSSSFEDKAFSYLENLNINFETHKSLPFSSKESDIYLKESDIWIELDGINREKKKEWLKRDYEYWVEKLKQYKEKELNLKIFYKFEEFKYFIDNMVR